MTEHLIGKKFVLEDGSEYEITSAEGDKVYGVCANWKDGYANECCQLVSSLDFVNDPN